MPAAPLPPSAHLDLPFRFVGGEACLDFVNTSDWTDDGAVSDRIPTYDRLASWGAASGIVDEGTADRLRQLAAERPTEGAAALEGAHALRATLQRLFACVAQGSDPKHALAEFNRWLGEASRRLRLVSSAAGAEGTIRFQRNFRGFGETFDSPLLPVISSASELLTSSDIARVRVCARPRCGWMYVDRSRNGFRRWCQMETCGMRTKGERRRRRAARAHA